MAKQTAAGFALIELSIVLMIIGLITGAILIGRDLIRMAELRKTHSQFEQLVAAVETFQGKYNCLPGDCAKATDFFGKSAACPYPPNGSPPGIPTCNGDGSGAIDDAAYSVPSSFPSIILESELAWQHLADANLVAGGPYSGTHASAAPTHKPGYNCPAIAGSASICWYLFDGPTLDAFPGWPMTIVPGSISGTAILMVGPVYNNPAVGKGFLTPAEAFAYDIKYDDGNPTTGAVQAQNSSFVTHCTNSQLPGASYDLTPASNQLNCLLIYRTSF